MNAQIKSLTGSQFFAAARGIAVRLGAHRCFFCGGPTDDHTPKEQAIRKTFTAFDRVAQGDYVCDGCLVAFDEDATITLVDGTVREHQRIRNYSWIITPDKALAATKTHKQELREFLLSPSRDTPYVVSISDSGQAHFLYLTRPTIARETARAYLDGVAIVYRVDELRRLIDLCAELIEVFGKKRVTESLSVSALAAKLGAIEDADRISELWNEWDRMRHKAAAKLALWLS